MTDPGPGDDLVTHIPALRAFALSLARDASCADDLVQDTLVRAWHRLDSYRPGTNMRAWLFTILRNSFYSDCRRLRREVPDTEGGHAARLSEKPAHDGRLQLAEFRAAFHRLPPEQREALILVGAAGFSYGEAADMCGVAVGTVKSRANRARRRLAEMLGLDGAEPLEMTDGVTMAVVNGGGRGAA